MFYSLQGEPKLIVALRIVNRPGWDSRLSMVSVTRTAHNHYIYMFLPEEALSVTRS